MASEKQLAANRRNAQKSTGPRTPSGKAASRMNAFQSGIYADSLVIAGEDPRQLDRLMLEYHAEFRPVTPRERDLVDAMVRNEWIVRRMGIIEAELWGHYFQTTAATRPHNRIEVLDRHWPLGQGLVAMSREFERLQRRVSALERSTRQALREIDELRARRESLAEDAGDQFAGLRADAEIESEVEPPADPEAAAEPVEVPEPSSQPLESEAVSDQIGFVPSNSVLPIPAARPLALDPATLVRPQLTLLPGRDGVPLCTIP